MDTSISASLAPALREGRALAADLRTAAANLRVRPSRGVQFATYGEDARRLDGYASRLDDLLDDIALTRLAHDVYSLPDDLDDGVPEQCGRSISHGRYNCQREYGHAGPCALFGFDR